MVFLQIFGNPGFGQNYLGFTIRRFPGDFWFGFNLGGIPIYLINTGVTKRLAHLTNIYYPLLTVFDKSFTKNVKDKLFCVRFKYRVTVKVTKYAKKWGRRQFYLSTDSHQRRTKYQCFFLLILRLLFHIQVAYFQIPQEMKPSCLFELSSLV